MEHFNTIPDILIIAKGIASGLPLSCIISKKELTDKQPPGSMVLFYKHSLFRVEPIQEMLWLVQQH